MMILLLLFATMMLLLLFATMMLPLLFGIIGRFISSIKTTIR
jgi:hypothetical protein